MTAATISKTKIAAKTITIHQAEGPHADCVKTTHSTWVDAEARIQRICDTAPKDGCYYKTDFQVEFADGEIYSGRYDSAHPESKAYEGTLAKHIRNHLEFYAGLRRPGHMSEADYDRILAERENDPAITEKRAEFLTFLLKYAFDDIAPEQPAQTGWRKLTGNTYPVKGLLKLLNGVETADGTWTVPGDKYAEAQAAIDRFAGAGKATIIPGGPVNPQNVPRGSGRVVATNVSPTGRTNANQPTLQQAPRPTNATKIIAKAKAKKTEPKLPPTALLRRLEALLAGTKAIHDSITPGDAIRPQLDFAIGHIQEALDRATKDQA